MTDYEVLIIPGPNEGFAFKEIIEALNPRQAKQIAKSRFPDSYKVGNNPRRL
jgi:hypothetical protein